MLIKYIDRTSDMDLTLGKEYESTSHVEDGWVHITDDAGDSRSLCPHRWEAVPAEQYIVWSPNSSLTPQRIFPTSSQARAVARKMSAEHEDTFYVCKLETKFEIEQTPSVVRVDL